MTRKPIGLSIPYRKIGCVQHDCEKCQAQRKLLDLKDYEAIGERYKIPKAIVKAVHNDIIKTLEIRGCFT